MKTTDHVHGPFYSWEEQKDSVLYQVDETGLKALKFSDVNVEEGTKEEPEEKEGPDPADAVRAANREIMRINFRWECGFVIVVFCVLLIVMHVEGFL
mmetsp:Transcript_8964/g.13782  ORF Transcript_8964/g.13782 Transcript_8964/m.13782 type:complete len:97 (+) Transcript_8964:180-470(+)